MDEEPSRPGGRRIAIILAPAQGETVTARGSVITLKATAASTEGRFSFMERTLPPGGRMPPSHTHDGEEVFYVLAGRVAVPVGGRTVPAGPGTFVLVPPQVPHTFGNDDQAEARVLILHHPAAERELMRRHGITPTPDHHEGCSGLIWRSKAQLRAAAARKGAGLWLAGDGLASLGWVGAGGRVRCPPPGGNQGRLGFAAVN